VRMLAIALSGRSSGRTGVSDRMSTSDFGIQVSTSPRRCGSAMGARRLSSPFWHGFLAAWFFGFLMVALLGPTAAGASSAGSRRIAVLGARSDLLGFLSAPPPSIPGATLENLSSADIAPRRLAQFDSLALLELCNVDPPLNTSQLDAVEE